MNKLSASSSVTAALVFVAGLVLLAAAPAAEARSLQGASGGGGASSGEELSFADEMFLNNLLQSPRNEKRAMRHPADDPRSLFAAIYG